MTATQAWRRSVRGTRRFHVHHGSRWPVHDPRLLRIYLDDHWAAAAGGKALARRVAKHVADPLLQPRLERVASDIADDDESLRRLRSALGLRSGSFKRLTVTAVERITRLTPNGRFVRRSPMSCVIEVESLIAGVVAQRELWRTLSQAAPPIGESTLDLATAVQRADDQLRVLEEAHSHVARHAFGAGGR